VKNNTVKEVDNDSNTNTNTNTNTVTKQIDERLKLQALSLSKECYSMKLDLVSNGVI
jgi:hypothetical protein